MDSIRVTGHEGMGTNVISLGLPTGNCTQIPETLPNNAKSCGSSNSTLPIVENLGNLTFSDDSIESSIKNNKQIGLSRLGSNGLVYGINAAPDVRSSSTNHQMDNSLAEKFSSQYQTCSTNSNYVSVANAVASISSETDDSLKELGTSDNKDEPCSSSTNCSVSERKDFSSDTSEISYVLYESELQMPDIMRLIQKDLSEPYSIYTYRYFIHNWPNLCFLAMHELECVGAIVCKLDMHRKVVKRGYIAMLAVDEKYRNRNIGSNLVLKAIKAMVADKADEVVLETEITNHSALRLYENLGFVRDKRLFRYYLNGVDALRLKLWLR